MRFVGPGKLEVQSTKRRQILNAAAKLFIARGYGAVSMDAVARSAGVSKATLYAYFASKDRLFETIISDACTNAGHFSDILSSASSAHAEDDPRATLTTFCRGLLRFLLQDDVLSIQRVVIAESPRFPELGRAFYDGGAGRGRKVLGEWIGRQCAAGRLFAEDPAEVADHFMAMLHGDLKLRRLLGLDPPPTEAQIERCAAGIVDMLMRAYGRPAVALAPRHARAPSNAASEGVPRVARRG